MRSTSRNQVRLGEEPRLGEWPIFSCARRMPLLFGYFEWRNELRGKKIGAKRTSIRKCSDILRASGLPAANRLALPCRGVLPDTGLSLQSRDDSLEIGLLRLRKGSPIHN